ncbi:RNA 2',3'-cyclic phosphodiesterase [Methanobrevibacter woesei]|uniref:RNA 2',3'-cyclic phosphodiesterase n=1 Tax=Methanobrevibacter woesei TaxID=190976 RepID=UPI0039F5C34A
MKLLLNNDIMSKIRAFLAIDLKEEFKPQIKEIIEDFKTLNTDIMFVEVENLHFTLKFFGDVDENKINQISEIVSNTLEGFDPFNLKIQGCGAFPNLNHIKVIWLGTEENTILNSLHNDLDEEFSKIGFKKDFRFSNHLTIGRMKSAKNKNQVKEKLNDYKTVEIGEMSIGRISLKKSTLTPNGPIYEDVKVFDI